MLEQVVRPFQREAPFAVQRIRATNVKLDVPAEVEFEFGEAGELPGAQQLDAPQEIGIDFKVITCDDKYNEVTRKAEPVRIENPEDSDQYLINNRVKNITFKKDEKAKSTDSAALPQATMAYEKTTSAYNSSVFESATFVTMNANNKMCRSRYYLNNGNV